MDILLGILIFTAIISGASYGFFNAFSSPDTLPVFRKWLLFLTVSSLGLGFLLEGSISAKLMAPFLLIPAIFICPGFKKKETINILDSWSDRKLLTTASICGPTLLIAGGFISDIDGAENVGFVYIVIGGFLIIVVLIGIIEKIVKKR